VLSLLLQLHLGCVGAWGGLAWPCPSEVLLLHLLLLLL
jgi:hypothetical protein